MSIYLLSQKELGDSRDFVQHMVVRASNVTEALAVATQAEEDYVDEGPRQIWSTATVTVRELDPHGPPEFLAAG